MNIFRYSVVFRVSPNVSGLCEEAGLEAQMFRLVQMFIRIPNVQFSTEPAFLQNPCACCTTQIYKNLYKN